MTCSKKNAHTEARDARCPHESELKQSVFNSQPRKMRTPGWVKRDQGPRQRRHSRTNNPVSQRSTPLTFLRRDFCVSTISGETRSSCSNRKKTQHCRGAVSTSTRAVACALASKPRTTSPSLLFVLSPARSKKKNRSFNSVTVSLIVEVTVEKQRSAPASAALKTARIRCTRSTCNVQQLREPIASDVVVSAQQSQPNCLFVTEMSTVHTSGSHMSCEMTTWHTRPSSRPPHRQGHPAGGLVMVRVDSASCIIFTFSLQTPCTRCSEFQL